MGRKNNFLSRAAACLFLSFLTLVSLPANSFALTAAQRLIYGQNNLLFYNPDEALCQPVYNGGSSSDSDSAPTERGNPRVEWATEAFGEFAMEMQREYGTPWEMVIAQMQYETGTGTDRGSSAFHNGAGTNNWLGIKGEGNAGTTGVYAIYSSVTESIKDWAGTRVLRSGTYNHAFPYLDPSNYNLRSFVNTVLYKYAPPGDGDNDPEAYTNGVMSIINGPIARKRIEKGWPTSEELAKKENIPIGGRHPLGSLAEDILSSQTTPTAEICSSDGKIITGENGAAIASLALIVAWPDNNHKNEVKPEFAEYAQKVGSPTSLGFAQDCGHFVSVVVRNTVDPDFPESYTPNQKSYMENSSNWTEIENLGNTSNLQPGDIFVVGGGGSSGHIVIYTGEVDGHNAASASLGSRTGNVGTIPFSDPRGTYSIFRFTGTASSQAKVNNVLGRF